MKEPDAICKSHLALFHFLTASGNVSLPPLVIHRHQKLLHVEAPHIFHLIDLEFCLQLPLKIPQLLLIIADRLIRQLSRPTVKPILQNCVIKVHTKTPLSLTKANGKRGKRLSYQWCFRGRKPTVPNQHFTYQTSFSV